MQPLLFPLSLVASILLSVLEFQTTGYPVTVPGVNTCRTGCKYVVLGQDTNTKKRKGKGERVKRIHIRYKNNAVLHHKKFQKT